MEYKCGLLLTLFVAHTMARPYSVQQLNSGFKPIIPPSTSNGYEQNPGYNMALTYGQNTHYQALSIPSYASASVHSKPNYEPLKHVYSSEVPSIVPEKPSSYALIVPRKPYAPSAPPSYGLQKPSYNPPYVAYIPEPLMNVPEKPRYNQAQQINYQTTLEQSYHLQTSKYGPFIPGITTYRTAPKKKIYIPEPPRYGLAPDSQKYIPEIPSYYVQVQPQEPIYVPEIPRYVPVQPPKFYIPETPDYASVQPPKHHLPDIPSYPPIQTPKLFPQDSPSNGHKETSNAPQKQTQILQTQKQTAYIPKSSHIPVQPIYNPPTPIPSFASVSPVEQPSVHDIPGFSPQQILTQQESEMLYGDNTYSIAS